MSKIYKHQTSLRIKADCEVNITGATPILIDYVKPSGSTGHFNCTTSTPVDGIMYFDVSESTTINESGWWKFWSDITFSDGRRAPGEPYLHYIYEEGSK